MAKTIIRETIIILLLCLAIILILGVVLYNYVPINKLIPQEVSYRQTQEVKTAIEESASADNTQIILTYEIDETDLDNYEKFRDYKPGKTNPFSSYQKEESNNNTSSNVSNDEKNQTINTTENDTKTNNDKENVNKNVNNNTKENETNKNSLFPDKGTK